MMNFIISLTFFVFAIRRLLSYLHFYQQEEYGPRRFLRWIWTRHNFDKRLSGVIIALSILQVFIPRNIVSFGLMAAFIVFALLEKNPLHLAKKPLVLTGRAKRLLGFAGIIMAVIIAAITSHGHFAILWLIPIHTIPFVLMITTILLRSYETRVNKSFRDEAVKKLSDINPFIIGVTGSYGKTSVKHILGHILQNYADTLITPGSVNTEMGIVRIIREHLKLQHKFFIVEMGAYGIGSISRLCALTPPKLSIITAIGAAHYERFKSLEDTAQAKFEIAESTLKQQGKIIVHENALESSYAREFYRDHQNSFVTCGLNDELKIAGSKQTKTGLEIDVIWQGRKYKLLPPLYGLHHVDNVVLAFVAAIHVGMPPEDVILSIQTLPQIKHRLEVKSLGSNILIDDAFNSNPLGFQGALDVLDMFGKDTGRRILVTPGMVELGDKHDEEHARLGKIAAATTDIALIVMPERIPSFIKAYQNNMNIEKQKIIEVRSFYEANDWISQNRCPGDVVLLENDLPDIYEKKMNI